MDIKPPPEEPPTGELAGKALAAAGDEEAQQPPGHQLLDPDSEQPPSYISQLWPAYMCVMVDYMGLALTIPIQPFLAADLGGSAAHASALVGTYSAGQLIGNIVMGRVSDRHGRRPVIIFSLLASTVGYVLCGVSQSLWFLFLARGVCGICGGTMPVAQAIVLDVVTDYTQRPKYLGKR